MRWLYRPISESGWCFNSVSRRKESRLLSSTYSFLDALVHWKIFLSCLNAKARLFRLVVAMWIRTSQIFMSSGTWSLINVLVHLLYMHDVTLSLCTRRIHSSLIVLLSKGFLISSWIETEKLISFRFWKYRLWALHLDHIHVSKLLNDTLSAMHIN